MKEIYHLIIKGEAFKRLIINRTTVTSSDGKDRSITTEIYNEPVNTFKLIEVIESVINKRIEAGEYSITSEDVKKFL